MAGLNPQIIGKTMPHGYAGSYARQPDMIVNTHPAGEMLLFGVPLRYDASGNVVMFGAGATAEDFVGVAAREIKTSLTYLEQSVGQYAPTEPVPVFQRGAINVKCNNGTPTLGGDVYIRLVADASLPQAQIGGFEAVADAANSVKIPNCKWAGPADANGIAELRILTMLNA